MPAQVYNTKRGVASSHIISGPLYHAIRTTNNVHGARALFFLTVPTEIADTLIKCSFIRPIYGLANPVRTPIVYAINGHWGKATGHFCLIPLKWIKEAVCAVVYVLESIGKICFTATFIPVTYKFVKHSPQYWAEKTLLVNEYKNKKKTYKTGQKVLNLCANIKKYPVYKYEEGSSRDWERDTIEVNKWKAQRYYLLVHKQHLKMPENISDLNVQALYKSSVKYEAIIESERNENMKRKIREDLKTQTAQTEDTQHEGADSRQTKRSLKKYSRQKEKELNNKYRSANREYKALAFFTMWEEIHQQTRTTGRPYSLQTAETKKESHKWENNPIVSSKE